MKRRKFLQGIAAGAGSAAVPMPVIAKTVTQASTKIVPFHYGWACVFAQMNNGITSADIERVFKISPTQAQGLMDRMLTRGVLHPAGLDGRSHATRAWEPWDKKAAAKTTQVNQESADQVTNAKTGTNARKKFRSFIAKMKVNTDFMQPATIGFKTG